MSWLGRGGALAKQKNQGPLGGALCWLYKQNKGPTKDRIDFVLKLFAL